MFEKWLPQIEKVDKIVNTKFVHRFPMSHKYITDMTDTQETGRSSEKSIMKLMNDEIKMNWEDVKKEISEQTDFTKEYTTSFE